jgi:hypothetical protein
MADQPIQTGALSFQVQPQAVNAAPTQGASQFALTISPMEILLAVGHSRVAMVNNPAFGPTPQLLQEWFITLALSPTSASMLCSSLKAAIDTYEKRFGVIPLDPNANVQVSDPSIVSG